MTQDSANRARDHDGCHETRAAAAVRALQDIDLEAAAHQLGPGAIAWTGDLIGGARWKLIRSLRAAEGNDLAPPFGVRRKHTVIDDEVRIGARNQRCELFEQLLRFEDDVIGTVAPRRLEADEDSSIRSPLQAAPSDGTPCRVLPSPARSCERCPYSATP